MKGDQQFRNPTPIEQALMQRLLEAEFPGRDELAPLIREVQAKVIDDDGSLELRSPIGVRAPVAKRIPVEAEAKDEDGLVIHALLHVIDGRPAELEIYKDDGSPIRRMPPPSAFELIVLPPAPE